MAINPNKPVQPQFDKQSVSEINKVTKTALEAVADVIYDADGDQTSLKDVKKAINNLSPGEKVALTAGTVLTGGALPVLSLIGEGTVKVAKGAAETGEKAMQKMSEAVKEKYSNPPEKKLAEELGKTLKDAGDSIEEFVDDLKDGRIYRDVSKNAKRFWRDNFTDPSPAEKVANKIKDKVEDLGHAAADAADDIKDGRMGKKIRKALD